MPFPPIPALVLLDRDRAGKPYGAVPWKLGILEPRGENPDPPERP